MESGWVVGEKAAGMGSVVCSVEAAAGDTGDSLKNGSGVDVKGRVVVGELLWLDIGWGAGSCRGL